MVFGPTSCVMPVDVLVRKFPSPLYTAVIVWLPFASTLVASVATPLPFTLVVPSEVLPALNVTVPVAAPAPGATALVVAVNVTLWPGSVGVAEVVTTVLVLALLTVWLSEVLVLPPKLASPL
jgi:hypothetical protein